MPEPLQTRLAGAEGGLRHALTLRESPRRASTPKSLCQRAFNTGFPLAALFPSERTRFGFGASSALGFFLCDFFGPPPTTLTLACFAGSFPLAMLTR